MSPLFRSNIFNMQFSGQHNTFGLVPHLKNSRCVTACIFNIISLRKSCSKIHNSKFSSYRINPTGQRPPSTETTLYRDHPRQRLPSTETTLDRDHPRQRPPSTETTLDRDPHPYGKERAVCILLECILVETQKENRSPVFRTYAPHCQPTVD